MKNKKRKVRIKKNDKSFFCLIKRSKRASIILFFIVFLAIPVTVVLSTSRTNIFNFAATSPYAIRGSIWLDTGEGYPPDGSWNNNEVSSTFAGSPKITLKGSNGVSLQTTPTNGGYSFENLSAGTYSISVLGFTPTNQASLQNIQLSASNPVNNTVNIGYYTGSTNGGSYVIAGSIWLDTNDPGGKPDGKWNNSEQPTTFTGNPQIQLKDTKTGQTWQTTPTNGGYSFHNLAVGSYSITVSSFTPTNPSDLSNIQLSSSNANPIVNIGYYTGNSNETIGNLNISGSIWVDSNGDGKWDNGEQPANNGAPGTVIELENSATRPIAQTTTTGAGYGFNNLSSGLYYIKIYGFTPTDLSNLQKIQLNSNINGMNIGYDPNNSNGGNNPSPTQDQNGGGGNNPNPTQGGSGNAICSTSSNRQCSYSSGCSTAGQICQCADGNWANHDKVYQCNSGNWQYKSETSNFSCTEKCL